MVGQRPLEPLIVVRIHVGEPHGERLHAMYAVQPGPTVEIVVEAQNRSNSMALHDCDVDRSYERPAVATSISVRNAVEGGSRPTPLETGAHAPSVKPKSDA